MVTTMNDLYYELFETATKALKDFKSNWIYDIDDANPYPKSTGEYYYRLENGVEKQVDLSEFKTLQEEVKAICEELDLDNDGKINSLEDYFSVLKTLSLNFDTNYQILPIDEPNFIIDLNTRSIKPPKGDYVYAVVGDDLAETLYFETDRYFDNVDLNDMTIAIVVNTGKEKYLVPISVRDITSRPAKIIFGWPISKEITENSTTLEFAVRFYTFNEKQQLAYNLSTQTNKLIVKPGLNYKTDEVNDLSTVNDRVANLLKNYNKLGTAAVLPPEFYYCSYASEYKHLEGEEEGNKKLQLFAGAETTEDTLLYSWKRSDAIDGDYVNALEETRGTDYYVLPEVTEEDIKLYPVFWIQNEDGSYTDVTLSSKDDMVKDEKYYREGKLYTATVPGFYYCVAKAKNKLRENSSATAILEIPAPAKLSFQLDIQTDIMLTSEKNSITIDDLQTKYGDSYLKDNLDTNKYVGNVKISCEGVPISEAGSYNIALKNTLNNREELSDSISLTIYEPIGIPLSLTVTINDQSLDSNILSSFSDVNNPILKINLGDDKREELNYKYILIHNQGTGEEKEIKEPESIVLNKGVGLYQLTIIASTNHKDFNNKDIETVQKTYQFVITD